MVLGILRVVTVVEDEPDVLQFVSCCDSIYPSSLQLHKIDVNSPVHFFIASPQDTCFLKAHYCYEGSFPAVFRETETLVEPVSVPLLGPIRSQKMYHSAKIQ